MWSRITRPVVLPIAVLALAPGPLEAQEERCDILQSRSINRHGTADGYEILYGGGPLVLLCPGGIRIEADSIIQYSRTGYARLMGNVLLQDSTMRLSASRVRYYEPQARIFAWSNVELLDRLSKTVITGDTIEILRRNEIRLEERLEARVGARVHDPESGTVITGGTIVIMKGIEADAEEQLRAIGGRPHALLYPDAETAATVDSTGLVVLEAGEEAGEPYDIFADEIVIVGERRVRANGQVEIRRGSMQAHGDSLEFDRIQDRLHLLGNARIEQEGNELTGRTITMLLTAGEIREATAREDALLMLMGERLRMTAPEIAVHFEGGSINRLMARSGAARGGDEEEEREEEGRGIDETAGTDEPEGNELPAQPEAISEDFLLRGDFMDILVRDEQPERLVASGNARGEWLGRDSLNREDTPEFARRDWLEGDTIIATFRPPEPTESEDVAEARTTLDQLISIGKARVLYREAPEDTVGAAPSEPRPLEIHYMRGERITLSMVDGEVDLMKIEGGMSGVSLQPLRRDLSSNGSEKEGGKER